MLFQHTAIHRNKRCVLAYLNSRAAYLRSRRWLVSGVLKPSVRERVSGEEANYFKEYDKILSAYMDCVGLPLTDMLDPPKELMVEVRLVGSEECSLVTDSGAAITLRPKTTEHVRRSDVEHLIRDGLLVYAHAGE